MTRLNSSQAATFFILVTTMLWGGTFAFIKDAVATFSVGDFMLWRFGLASLLMGLIFFKHIHFTNIKLMKEGMVLGLLFGLGAYTQSMGLRFTSASTASFITVLEVIWVPIFIGLYKRSWPGLMVSLAVLLAVAGILFITWQPGFHVNPGDIWVVVCSLFFACYTLAASKISHSGEPLTITFFQLLTIAVLGFVLSLGHLSWPKTANVWWSIVYCAIFASVLAFYLQVRFQRYVTATKAAIIFSAEPVFATLTAIVYLNENLSYRFFAGAVLIFSGILLSEFKLKEKILPQE